MSDGLERNQDIFLKVETAKQGPIKGESQDDKHPNEIEVIAWSWGMESKSALASGGATGKATIKELRVVKRFDSATTALMSSLRNNDQIKKAVLTVRKAGSKQIDFLKVTIEKGRLTSIDVESSGSDMPELVESIAFSFQKISVEYVAQGVDGQPKGSWVFETSMEPD